jgi:uncharacterized OB-fold protein
MSELRDSFREWRDRKARYRLTLITCYRCGKKYRPEDERCPNCEAINVERCRKVQK